MYVTHLPSVLVVERDLRVVACHHDRLAPGKGEGHAGVAGDDVGPSLRAVQREEGEKVSMSGNSELVSA